MQEQPSTPKNAPQPRRNQLYEDLTLEFQDRGGALWGVLAGRGAKAEEELSEPLIRDLLPGGHSNENLEPWNLLPETELRRLGRGLHEAVLVGSLGALWEGERGRILDSGHSLRLRVALDPTQQALSWLEALPWEALLSPPLDNFLALDRRFSIVRGLPVPLPVEPPRPHTNVRVLLVASSPKDLQSLDIDGEIRAIRAAVGHEPKLEVCAYRPQRLQDLRDRLLDEDFQILHFMGHGFHRPGDATQSPPQYGLMLEDASGLALPIPAKDWVRRLTGTGLRWVVLNACHTADPSSIQQAGASKHAFQGVAQALVRGGIPSVVAMQHTLSDASAIRFAATLYRSLRRGDGIEAAMVEARQAMTPQGTDAEETTTPWVSPVLFLRGQGEEILTNRERASSSSPASPKPRPSLPPNIDFESLIQRHTQNFVGRRHIFEHAQRFVEQGQGGYLRLEGHPGTGKTAVLASMAQRHGYLAYFNSRAEGVISTLQFLQDLSSRLIRAFDLPYEQVPSRIGYDHHIFGNILQDVGRALDPRRPLILVVDALDEVDPTSRHDGANVLYLPSSLSPSIVFIVSTRPRHAANLTLRTISPQQTLRLEDFEEENRADVETYINQQIDRMDLLHSIRSSSLTRQDFVHLLAERSENNFMFLFHALEDIKDGIFDLSKPETLPQGLAGYYVDHWERLNLDEASSRHRANIRILYYLCQFRRPATLDELAQITGERRDVVHDALRAWDQFLLRQAGTPSPRFSLYHASFRDFLMRENMLKDVSISLEEIDADLVQQSRKRYGVVRRRSWR